MIRKPESVVVLVSGGMDSVTALYDAHDTQKVVGALSYFYGSKHNSRELPFAAFHAKKLAVPHTCMRLDFIGEFFRSDLLETGGSIPEGHYEDASMKKTVVPFRNGILLSIAAGFAESLGAEGIVIAAHAGDHAIYPDCREDFMISMAEAIRAGTYSQLALTRPFIRMSKAQIARRGFDLGIDYSQTWSCYVGGKLHCGKCGTCVERREAFSEAGIPDPTSYLTRGPLPSKASATATV
jgi:7-cyano-7-deazaguanine synthase